MRSVQYGSRTISYSFKPKNGLKSHYISVEREAGVVLKGKPVPAAMADKLILKKARWILEKMELVRSVKDEEIVTGSRLPYLGKTYYVQISVDRALESPIVTFNYSKFQITVPGKNTSQDRIMTALELFYKEKAIEKIMPRVEKLSQKTGLSFNRVQFRKMNRRWGSCTAKNSIIINTDAIKLPFALIDYLIVHELVHTRVKDHSKAYWKELSRHIRNWKMLDEKMKTIKL
ncbi:MAG TPA: SprT family zinc-dependent metalloprotease [Flavisolibacter sp.]|nr:SprT family zinc-dependent metalloprotease [Flavisolibacter sp.]